MFFAVNLFQYQTIKTMARPIKETPVLSGQDAINFYSTMNTPKKASEKEIKDIKDAGKYFRTLLKDPNSF
jgi:hypothetical protein